MKTPAASPASMEPAMHPDMHPAVQACTLQCTPACTLACMHPGMEPAAYPAVHPVQEQSFCRKGLSSAQINIISLLLGIGANVTKYRELACSLERFFGIQRSPDAVRGIVERLAGRGILRRRFAREGMLQGVVFELVQAKLCPHIRSTQAGMEPAMHPAVHPPMHPDMYPAPSILEKIDRKKNLSISSQGTPEYKERLEALSEEDMAFHWPELARSGFGTAQIRQIIQRREQLGEDTRHIMQGLAYAEWALAHNAMHDKNGAAVTSPANWVFKILATQGYYPRPPGYVSPYEQAERDHVVNLKKEQEAHEARMTAAYEAWVAKLTAPEKTAIVAPREGPRLPMPEGVRLRQHFRDAVWPVLHGSDSP